MTSLDKYFGNFLKVEDVTEEMEVVVERIVPQQIESEDGSKEKLIVYFEGFEKPLVLNKTNADSLAEIAGTREIEELVGTRACLYVDKNVKFHGRKVGGLRLKMVKPSQEKP